MGSTAGFVNLDSDNGSDRGYEEVVLDRTDPGEDDESDEEEENEDDEKDESQGEHEADDESEEFEHTTLRLATEEDPERICGSENLLIGSPIAPPSSDPVAEPTPPTHPLDDDDPTSGSPRAPQR
jgi:hypothetical protein